MKLIGQMFQSWKTHGLFKHNPGDFWIVTSIPKKIYYIGFECNLTEHNSTNFVWLRLRDLRWGQRKPCKSPASFQIILFHKILLSMRLNLSENEPEIYMYKKSQCFFFSFWLTIIIIEPHHEKTCFWHMRTTKMQISLRIRAVWSALVLFPA